VRIPDAPPEGSSSLPASLTTEGPI
jgi:hypothetical protein